MTQFDKDLEIVKQDGLALEYVITQAPEICMAAVKQNGHALHFVKDQTSELCLEAVKNNGIALVHVKDQTEEICMEAVKQDGHALRYVENITSQLIREAKNSINHHYPCYYQNEIDFVIRDILRRKKLIECPDCTKEISKSAKFCPGCGCTKLN